MTIEIRRLGADDVAAFDRVAEGVFDHAIDHAGLAAYLATPGHHFIAAFADGEMVGQLAAVLHRHPDRRPTELYIDELGVAPSFQRRGIAARLLETAFVFGRELGCSEAWVGTEPDNLPARMLYQRRSLPAEPFTMYVFRL
jgi:ribosomal protein S18 acetylase RimI-like enzyme